MLTELLEVGIRPSWPAYGERVPSPLAAIDAWPRPRAAAVLVGGEVVDDRGDVDVAVPWASVTKLATAAATLAAVDAGHLGLDDAAGPPAATVRHLLAHASGLDFETTDVRAAPATRRIYSNSGYDALAATVGAAVGMPFDAWLRRSVLDPLGMGATRLQGSPASGLIGPLGDLIGLVEELQRPRLLTGNVTAAMRTVAFPHLPGVLPGFGFQRENDWGLGAEIRDGKQPHWTGPTNSPATFGHFGRSGTFVWLDPLAGVACACVTATEFGPWAKAAWPRLAEAVVAAHRLTGRPG